MPNADCASAFPEEPPGPSLQRRHRVMAGPILAPEANTSGGQR